MHTPVFADDVIKSLEVKPERLYIDATAGEGGHLERILNVGARVLAIDWDNEQIAHLHESFAGRSVVIECGNFADIAEIARQNDFYPVDGVLFDLGLSMWQISASGRGFSYKNLGEPLDMRLNTQEELTAAEILNTWSTEKLADLFSRNSEELLAEEIAEKIVKQRRFQEIKLVGDLIAAIDSIRPEYPEKTYARIFQALRMTVNHELVNIERGLEGSWEIVKPGGKIVVVTFHSVEDRVVKLFARQNLIELETIRPTTSNEFERSAIIRVFRKGYETNN